MNELNIIIGLFCSIIGAGLGIWSYSRTSRKETKEESRDFTRVESKLDYVSKGVDDIRLDIKATDRRVSDIAEKLIRVEESTKSAHHRIDGLVKEE
jgi:septal ring factor EnvC (AmiA/AmiB activator)